MWTNVKLSDIGSIIGGATPSTSKESYYGGDVPWITPKDLSSFHDRYIERGERNITQEGLESCSAQLLPVGSVLFSSRAPIGYVAIAKNPVATNQGFKSIVPDSEKADSLFLYYLLRNNKDNIEALGSGTTFKEVSGATMKNFEVTLPPLAEQKRIAAILGALDDKIELNRRINANLEEQAQALFKQWFIKDNDDCNLGKLGDIIEIFDSQRKPVSGNERDKMQKLYPYYGAAALMDYVDDYLFDGIYLLLGEDGSVVTNKGFPVLQYVEGKFWVNNHTHILQGKNGFSVEVLYILLSQTNIQSIITGAVQPKISQYNLRNLQIPILPTDKVKSYDNIIQPMFRQIRKNNKENCALELLRDTLLPKLMSGGMVILQK